MGAALLVEYYQRMPTRRPGEDVEAWERRQEGGRRKFIQRAGARYAEATLLRLLESGDVRARRAALAALGRLGGMGTNAAVAARLKDDDAEARRLAAEALWGLWFRADTEANVLELQRLIRLRDRDAALAGFDRLVGKAPDFAEAYNQRAVLLFRMKQYERSIADCEKALRLNPHHFGAQAGMGQCYLQLRKHRAALKAFRAALRINPNLDEVAETIRALETALGEEGRKDDKK